LYVLDWAYLTLGQRARATHSRRAACIFEELGDLTSMGNALNVLGTLAYYAGDWDEALDFYAQAASAWMQAGDRWNAAFASFNTAEILSNQGRPQEAEPLLHEALRSWLAAGSASSAAAALAELGRIEARRRRTSTALELLEEARSAYAEAGEDDGVLDTEARVAEALLLGGDAERSLARASTALARCVNSSAGMYVEPFLTRVIGCAHLLTGRLEAGRTALDESLEASEALEAEYELALTLDAIAALQAVTGGDGIAKWRRDELFTRLGIQTSTTPVIAG
jgi:tetratricopeptide (TPR) repeat protein